jgi:chloride channel protein, CIC family
VFGYTPVFGSQPQIGFDQPIQLLYYAILGVACGLMGILYARSFYGIGRLFHRLALPKWLKPAIGGLVVGCMGLVLPGCLHMGYGWVQAAMGPSIQQLPLWVILVLPFAKILSTSLSIGSGGSGGIFGPGMVIGGMLGASCWRLFHAVLPGMPTDSTSFVIIGMIGMFGGIAHAPLAVMLMVAEMTGNLSLLAPAMIVVAISTALVGNNTIYSAQVPDRASSPAHRMRFSFPLLSSLLVRDAMSDPVPCVQAKSALADVARLLGPDGIPGVVVLNEHQEFVGIILRDQLTHLPVDSLTGTPVERIVDAKITLALDSEQPLDIALEGMVDRGISWAPVLQDGRITGKLTMKDIIGSYSGNLQKSVRRTRIMPGNAALIEARLSQFSSIVGRTLRETKFPTGTLLLSITREGEAIFPKAETRLLAGDLIVVMADPLSETAVKEFLEPPPQQKIERSPGKAPRE